MNNFVSFEVAKLLKEKGFDSVMKYHYPDLNKNQEKYCLPTNWNKFVDMDGNSNYYSAPTIAEVLMWMYEKHGIWINIKHLPFNQKFGISITGKYQDGENGILYRYDFKHYNSPTEAYEAAIEYCLKNLIN